MDPNEIYSINKVTIMTNIIAFFSGKKSYVVGILTIILGYMNNDTQMIMTGLGIITLRDGIAKK